MASEAAASLYVFLAQLIVGVSPAAQSRLVCPHQPITALAGDDVILPCRLEPPADATSWTVEWTGPGLDQIRPQHGDGSPSHQMSVDGLGQGDVSLRILGVAVSDGGTYTCSVPALQAAASVRLDVGSVSSPVIRVSSSSGGRLVFLCEAGGWYPEPEVVWLDGEGTPLPAGPAETLRGPDGLYSVSSRVSVDRRHGLDLVCRVQQTSLGLSRETTVYIAAFSSHPGVFHHETVAFLLLLLVGVVALCVFVSRKCRH